MRKRKCGRWIVQIDSQIEHSRAVARAHETELPAEQRKALGQFFTGLPLGRVLSYLAVSPKMRTAIDPFAGTGDLVDAVLEAATSHEIPLERLDAVEFDADTASVCRKRLALIASERSIESDTITGDAFSPENIQRLQRSYDLVITNPPYVRYQMLNGRGASVRENLVRSFENGLLSAEWSELAAGYSGLADLSVPAWLLSASLVRPGGRLAIVVPSTWRSREYGDIVRYLLLRFFQLETVVEDTQPGWFSDALVRTQLIVARRLTETESSTPVGRRGSLSPANWIEVTPDASSSHSLLGEAFPGPNPEAEFACWEAHASQPVGISARKFDLNEEWQALLTQCQHRSWFCKLERLEAKKARPSIETPTVRIPQSILEVIEGHLDTSRLQTLETVGIQVGQGLRTGCNRFFYVRAIGPIENGTQVIECDKVYGGHRITVPCAALRPVLHRQSDLPAWGKGQLPDTRLLDLRSFVLPSDLKTVEGAARSYSESGEPMPSVMPTLLASHVKKAAREPISSGKPAPDLSAVRTNIRSARKAVAPRFWYMLPDFKPRHLPQAFVARIINSDPWVYANSVNSTLVDANFSTFWTQDRSWTANALSAFLNSVWCRANMEALGTPLAGGALKLEAVQLRKIPVPTISPELVEKLDAIWSAEPTSCDIEFVDQLVLSAAFPDATTCQTSALKDSLYRELSASISRRRKGGA